MPIPTIAKTLAAVLATSLLVAACGGSADTPSSSAPGTPTETAAPELTDQQAAPARLDVDVTIAGGQVTPTNAQLEARVDQPIVIRVTSDVADELHVHSTPEHTFAIEPRGGQAFQFTAEVPGTVDVELHDLNKTVATITVRQ